MGPLRRSTQLQLGRLTRTLLVAGACFLVPGALACEPAAQRPAVQPSSDPSTAAMGADGVVEAKLLAPQGEWRLDEVEVEGAKLLSRDGDTSLVLRMKMSELKMGETAIEGEGEPVKVSVTYVEKKSGGRAKVVFRLAVPAKAEQGTKVPVTVEW